MKGFGDEAALLFWGGELLMRWLEVEIRVGRIGGFDWEASRGDSCTLGACGVVDIGIGCGLGVFGVGGCGLGCDLGEFAAGLDAIFDARVFGGCVGVSLERVDIWACGFWFECIACGFESAGWWAVAWLGAIGFMQFGFVVGRGVFGRCGGVLAMEL
jgi:hypothetical protein